MEHTKTFGQIKIIFRSVFSHILAFRVFRHFPDTYFIRLPTFSCLQDFRFPRIFSGKHNGWLSK